MMLACRTLRRRGTAIRTRRDLKHLRIGVENFARMRSGRSCGASAFQPRSSAAWRRQWEVVQPTIVCRPRDRVRRVRGPCLVRAAIHPAGPYVAVVVKLLVATESKAMRLIGLDCCPCRNRHG